MPIDRLADLNRQGFMRGRKPSEPSKPRTFSQLVALARRHLAKPSTVGVVDCATLGKRWRVSEAEARRAVLYAMEGP